MSKKKWGFKKLTSIRGKLSRGHAYETTNDSNSLEDIPIDWYEFNQLYFSSRPVVVECPQPMWEDGDHLMALDSALRMSRDNRRVGIVSTRDDGENVKTDHFYNALTLAKDWKTRRDRVALLDSIPQNGDVSVADDWILYANWTYDKFPTLDIVEWMESTNGFRDIKDPEPPRYYRQTVFPHKFVVLWDSSNKETYLELKEKFGKKVLFLDYTHEKEKVDEWFLENRTMVDPMFDMTFMEPGLNMKKVYSYIATNHLPKLREYAKLFPETVEKYFTKEELSEMGCKFGPPYDRYNYGK